MLIEIPEGSEKEDTGPAACFSEHSGAINLTLLHEKERLEKQLQEERRKWNKTEQKMKDTIERLRAKVIALVSQRARLMHKFYIIFM